ncbi:hypothetical protein [Bacillus pumilus]|uniref:hypothetical protein n=1 Tax=Bacillus pumilus TaxID=1408 RepID=UPI00164337DA
MNNKKGKERGVKKRGGGVAWGKRMMSKMGGKRRRREMLTKGVKGALKVDVAWS